ncbi:MAG TPA: FAD-dependent oxidoreductase [Acidimicrobiales bacterium]|nr:FAD-dependent oxidoreductase [Acidimicrobiales bacterium]
MAVVDDTFDYEEDVLVVGSGCAGLTASLAAKEAGASVLVLEAGTVAGGAEGNSFWIPNNRSMREAFGLRDDREDALRYMCRLAYPQFYVDGHPTLGLPQEAYDLIATFYDQGSSAIDFLKGLGFVIEAEPHSAADYHAGLPEDKAPRGRFMKAPPGNPRLAEQLVALAEGLGVKILTGHRVVDALKNAEGEVVALLVRAGHRTVLARARRAVVFASGGFGFNQDRLREHLPARVYGTCTVETNRGDFVDIGQRMGARMSRMHGAWWKQGAVEQAVQNWRVSPVFMPFGDSMVQVNRYGRRVVNEKLPYNERGQIHLRWDPEAREYPNLLLFMIWDDVVARDGTETFARPPVPMPGEDASHVIKGDTWEELAARIDDRLVTLAEHTGGVRLDGSFVTNLVDTVRRFGTYAATGVDEEFHRGEGMIELDWLFSRRPGATNPAIAPFAERGPYYCVILGASVLDTHGGPRVNTLAQVVDGDDRPIPGLYGAGNCVAAISGQAYWGPGATMGPAVTYGYIAGRQAAGEPVKDATLLVGG